MPMYLYRDESGHEREEFTASADDKGCRTLICQVCRSTMAPVIAFGRGLCYFEEGRARRIWNLENADGRDAQGNKIQAKPVYVRSHEEHKRLMKQRGVDFANRGVGYKGQWI